MATLTVGGKPLHNPTPPREPSASEHRFTSTGVKFWRHGEALEAYKRKTGRTVISTHISPEGRCNLTCSYCSVSERTLKARLELPRIQEYVRQLLDRGLKAVILTGGGEPTLYPQFNELAEWLLDWGLELALISNGTQFNRVSDRVLKSLTWLRVSMNVFRDWEKKIVLPVDRLGEQTVLGLSVCFAGDNRDPEFLKRVAPFAAVDRVKYVRVLPDCMLPQDLLLREHDALDALFATFPGGDKWFHQFKVHEAPGCATCHQSHFRPYLSEAIDPDTGLSGLVFPCDSVVLNEQSKQFKSRWALCPPEKIGDYLDGRIPQRFDARTDCSGCVFTRNVNMLDRFVNGAEDRRAEFARADLAHANFV